MSYSQTVTCSYCYAEGHNRVSCPVRKRDVQKLIDEGRSDHHLVRQDKKYKTKKTRYCSYCRNRHDKLDSSHDRRSCGMVAEDRKKLVALTKDTRARTLTSMAFHGIGLGALVRVDMGRWRGHAVGLVTDVAWDNIGALSKIESSVCYIITRSPGMERAEDSARIGLGASRKVAVSIPNSIAQDVWPQGGVVGWRPEVEIIGRVSEEAIQATVPPGWLEGESKRHDASLAKDNDKNSWWLTQMLERFNLDLTQ